jgi:hypothetical protein
MTDDLRAGLHWLRPTIRRLPRSVKPVQDETVKSYLKRLATANHGPIEDLARYVAPHTWPLDPNARGRIVFNLQWDLIDVHTGTELPALAMAAGLPESTLAYALPELRHQYSASHSMALVGRNVAGDPNNVRPACRHCMAAKGITTEVRVWMRHDQAVCLRHSLWIGPGASNPRDHIDLSETPEIMAAQRRHRLLIHQLRRRWVFVIAKRAFDFADYWVPEEIRLQRYARLPQPGWPCGISNHGAHWHAALYPEAVALTGVLASHPWRSRGLAMDDHEAVRLIGQRIRAQAIPHYETGQRWDPISAWLTLLHDRPESIHLDLRWLEWREYEQDLVARETTRPSPRV